MIELNDHIPELNEALVQLDLALTGKCPHNAMARTVTLEQALFEVIYMNDGGYSRIAFNDQTMKLFLTSNSRTEVKEKWGQVESERQKVESLLQGYWKELENSWR